MKYVEELVSGDTFTFKDKVYLITSDFKSNNQRLCYSLNDGFPSWMTSDTIVDHSPVYILDKDNNTVPVKITKKTNVSS